jgi:hypothetical protein
MRFASLTVVALVLLFSLSCKNEVNLNAPAKDMLVVYGVLNPASDLQFIRVSKLFLPDGDAIQYAANNDLTLNSTQAEVTLQGVKLRDTFITRNTGIFTAGQHLFYLTRSDLLIQPGTRYDLEIKYLPNQAANVKAHTTIPDNPQLISPFSPIYSGGGLNIANAPVAFENATKITIAKTAKAASYELRMFFKYFENGVERNVTYGPKSFTSSVNCTGGKDICYGLQKGEVLDFILSTQQVKQPSPNYYTSIDTPVNVPLSEIGRLNKSNYLSITAVDSFLYLYMLANNSNSSSFATSTLEYSNVENGAGVFGSFSEAGTYVDFTQCGKFLLNFNNTQSPGSFCRLN